MSSEENNTSLWQFIRNVGRHWVALMSGGIIIVALGVFERLTGQNIPLWVYIAVLVFFLFLACYLAWRDERNSKISLEKTIEDKEKILADKDKVIIDREQTILEIKQSLLQEREKRTPQLVGAIYEIATAEIIDNGTKYTAVTLTIAVSNLGMPSVAIDWTPIVIVPGKNPRMCPYFHVANELTLGYEGGSSVIKGQDMIYEKTATPIETGARVTGYLHFRTTIGKDEIRSNEGVIQVLFRDVIGKEYFAIFEKNNSTTLPAPRHTPGVQTRIKPINQPTPRRKKR